jgi:hypothetical protein
LLRFADHCRRHGIVGKKMLKSTRPDEIFYRRDPRLVAIGDRLIGAAMRKFSGTGLTNDGVALTLVVPEGASAIGWNHRGGRPVYPARVVKLFYMVAAHAWRAEGRLPASRELDRALSAMIRESSNDAASYIVDLLSGAVGGPELAAAAFKRWIARRQAVNRYFRSWRWPEFEAINVLQKTWDDGPYGRERQARTGIRRGRNMLTSDATARLLWAIARGEAVSRAASRAMLSLLAQRLHRVPHRLRRPTRPRNQPRSFSPLSPRRKPGPIFQRPVFMGPGFRRGDNRILACVCALFPFRRKGSQMNADQKG